MATDSFTLHPLLTDPQFHPGAHLITLREILNMTLKEAAIFSDTTVKQWEEWEDDEYQGIIDPEILTTLTLKIDELFLEELTDFNYFLDNPTPDETPLPSTPYFPQQPHRVQYIIRSSLDKGIRRSLKGRPYLTGAVTPVAFMFITARLRGISPLIVWDLYGYRNTYPDYFAAFIRLAIRIKVFSWPKEENTLN